MARVSRALPALRRNLDLMLSPVRDRPGLLMRDPFRYTEDVLIIPPPLVPFLRLFDGGHGEADLEKALVEATGESGVDGVVRHLVDTLDRGFLESEAFVRRRDERHEGFAKAPRREAVHAGAAYPEEPGALGRWLEAGLGPRRDPSPVPGPLVGLAAPHVSPEGGWRSYAAAYGALPAHDGVSTVVVLGTSHYGEPETFGLTRKAYATPLGEAGCAPDLVDRLARAGGAAVRMEDYCHAVEHSIEFQVLFLQNGWGKDVRVLPILCGPFARATEPGGRPEDDPGVARFLDTLSELAAREGDRLLWVLGVDLAHIGRRYGDRDEAKAGEGRLQDVAQRDRERLERVTEGDADGFWSLLREGGDDLRWCGASPLYTFLRAAGPVRGALLEYEQWNIDPESVVSFAAIAFRRAGPGPGKGEA
jgi:AmmeMemoRadiSam system protein B